MSGDISGEEEVETMTVVTGVIRHRLCEKCCSVLRRLYSSCGTATKVAQMFCSVRCFLFFFFTLLSLTHRRQVCVCVFIQFYLCTGGDTNQILWTQAWETTVIKSKHTLVFLIIIIITVELTAKSGSDNTDTPFLFNRRAHTPTALCKTRDVQKAVEKYL